MVVKGSGNSSEIRHLFENSGFKYDKRLGVVKSGLGVLCFFRITFSVRKVPENSLKKCSVEQQLAFLPLRYSTQFIIVLHVSDLTS